MRSPDRPASAAGAEREVRLWLDSHSLEETGGILWDALHTAGGGGMAQLRGLQSTVYSALVFNDIRDFIKNQMGKESRRSPRWTRRPPHGGQMAGERLLADLDGLRSQAQAIVATTAGTSQGPSDHDVALMLARGWMRSVSAEYLYRKSLGEE